MGCLPNALMGIGNAGKAGDGRFSRGTGRFCGAFGGFPHIKMVGLPNRRPFPKPLFFSYNKTAASSRRQRIREVFDERNNGSRYSAPASGSEVFISNGCDLVNWPR